MILVSLADFDLKVTMVTTCMTTNLIPQKLRQARPAESGPYCNSSAELANSIARNVDLCNTKKDS